MKKLLKRLAKFIRKSFNIKNKVTNNIIDTNINSTVEEPIKLEPIKMGAGKSSYDLFKSERDKRLGELGVPELMKEANEKGETISRLEDLGIESKATDIEKEHFHNYLKGQSEEIVAIMRAVDQKHISKARRIKKSRNK